MNNLSYSLMNADVDLNPHQIEAAVFALNHPKGVILADEVGLGKTIEAGLVLTQLWAEGRKKLLVVCPAMLRTQWKQELEDKFHLPVIIADSSNFHNLPDGHVHILSYHFASSVYEELAAVEWDYVVLDEAHRLRNLYQEDSVIAKNIFNAVYNRRKALLTATPLQNSLMELYSLITFIDDTVFSSPESFFEQYGYGFNQDKLKERIQPYIKRTLRRDVLEYIRYTERKSIVCRYKPSSKEAELYAKVSEYINSKHIWAVPPYRRPVIMFMLRKYLSSSTAAVLGTLRIFVERLNNILNGAEYAEFEEEILSDYEEYEYTQPSYSYEKPKPDRAEIENEKAFLKSVIELGESIEADSKAPELLKALKNNEALQLKSSGKAVIFTESVRTQYYLKDYLETHGYETALFNGSKDELDKFKGDTPILISTESGAEGLNLQFCNVVINYDLPWNPQRIEQRIGRCHRYGQKNDVTVINFINTDNLADLHVYSILEQKFKLFDGMFGASDEVLGAILSGVALEMEVYRIIQSNRTPEEIDKAFTDLRNSMEPSIERKTQEAKRILAESFNSDVSALLKTKEDSAKLKAHNLDYLWYMTKYILAEDGRYYFNDDLRIFGTLKDEVRTGHRQPYANMSFAYNIGEEEDVPPAPVHMMKKHERKAWNSRRMTYHPGSKLGQSVMERARSLRTPVVNIKFNADIPYESGYLQISSVAFKYGRSLAGFSLIISICDENGNALPDDIADKLLLSEGAIIGESIIPESIEKFMMDEQKRQEDKIVADFEAYNRKLYEEEKRKLEAYTADKQLDYGLELKKTSDLIEKLDKRIENEPMSFKARLDLIDERDEMINKQTALRLELFEKEDEEKKKLAGSVEKLAKRLKFKHNVDIIFQIKWSVETQ